MRKVALLAAIALSVAFLNTSTSVAATDAELYNLNKNGHDFVRDLWNPYAATSKPAAAPKTALAMSDLVVVMWYSESVSLMPAPVNAKSPMHSSSLDR